MTIELIRTVVHRFRQDSEAVLTVSTLTHDGRDAFEAVTLGAQDRDEGSLMLHSETQAVELIHAIRAAGKRLGWFDA